MAHHYECRVLVARQADETKRHLPCKRWRAIEHHEGEGAAAQQHVGTPGAAGGITRADHAKEVAVERCPIGGIEGTRSIDACDSLTPRQRGTDERANQCRRARAMGADEFDEPATGNAAPQRLIELLKSGRNGIGHHRWRGNDLFEPGPKLG